MSLALNLSLSVSLSLCLFVSLSLSVSLFLFPFYLNKLLVTQTPTDVYGLVHYNIVFPQDHIDLEYFTILLLSLHKLCCHIYNYLSLIRLAKSVFCLQSSLISCFFIFFFFIIKKTNFVCNSFKNVKLMVCSNEFFTL